MKLGLGLYRHMLKQGNFKFVRQCGCTYPIIHLAEYYQKEIVTATGGGNVVYIFHERAHGTY